MQENRIDGGMLGVRFGRGRSQSVASARARALRRPSRRVGAVPDHGGDRGAGGAALTAQRNIRASAHALGRARRTGVTGIYRAVARARALQVRLRSSPPQHAAGAAAGAWPRRAGCGCGPSVVDLGPDRRGREERRRRAKRTDSRAAEERRATRNEAASGDGCRERVARDLHRMRGARVVHLRPAIRSRPF